MRLTAPYRSGPSPDWIKVNAKAGAAGFLGIDPGATILSGAKVRTRKTDVYIRRGVISVA